MKAYIDAANAILQPKLELLKAKARNPGFSDVVDDSTGHQYVDLVMEGGGMLGFGLLGYTYALEQVGIRFWNIAGTSAGAITAGFLAAAGEKHEAKSVRVLEALAQLDTKVFMDGHPKVVRTFQAQQAGTLGPVELGTALLEFNPFDLIGRMRDGHHWTDFLDNPWLDAAKSLGFNPGKTFLDWATKVIRGFGITTTAELEDRMKKTPGSVRGPANYNPTEAKNVPRLAMIAADVITQTKVIFPENADLYWDKPADVCPAEYIRASMAVPFFFEPFVKDQLPVGKEKEWRRAGYHGAQPKKAVFLDGGIVSNFPIGMFHARGIPACPTFGAKLNYYRREEVPVGTLAQLAAAMFFQAKNSLDQDFLQRNADYEHLVAYIDTRGHGWLNFAMEEKGKVSLFASGVKAAVDFLTGFTREDGTEVKGFDWPAYKRLRDELAASPATVGS